MAPTPPTAPPGNPVLGFWLGAATAWAEAARGTATSGQQMHGEALGAMARQQAELTRAMLRQTMVLAQAWWMPALGAWGRRMGADSMAQATTEAMRAAAANADSAMPARRTALRLVESLPEPALEPAADAAKLIEAGIEAGQEQVEAAADAMASTLDAVSDAARPAEPPPAPAKAETPAARPPRRSKAVPLRSSDGARGGARAKAPKPGGAAKGEGDTPPAGAPSAGRTRGAKRGPRGG